MAAARRFPILDRSQTTFLTVYVILKRTARTPKSRALSSGTVVRRCFTVAKEGE